MLAIDEIVDHAALNRAGPVERVQRAQVFDAIRLIAAQNIAHAGRFKLEHAAGKALLKIFRRFACRRAEDLRAAIFTPRCFSISFDGVLDDGQRGQAQEIHLEKRQLLQAVHVVLRDNFVFVGVVERNQFPQRHRRNHHARGVQPALRAMPSSLQRLPALPSRAVLGRPAPPTAAPAIASFSLMLSVLAESAW